MPVTETLKLPPLVIDKPTAALIHRLAGGANVSDLIRKWIRDGVTSSPSFNAMNSDNLTADQICIVNKHGRPRKKPTDIIAKCGVLDVATPAVTAPVVSGTVVADSPTVT